MTISPASTLPVRVKVVAFTLHDIMMLEPLLDAEKNVPIWLTGKSAQVA
jgi:hypothetical protein